MTGITTQQPVTLDRAAVRLSVVVPMYRSEKYLPELLASFGRQEPGPYEVEYIFVDDGSPDRCHEIAARWLESGSRKGKVVRQANGGVSSARNRGIAEATGDWVGMPDGDDFVGDRYLAGVAEGILANASKKPVLVATNVKWYIEATSKIRNNHVLRYKFALGTRVVDLDERPQYIQSQAATAFFRKDIIEAGGVSFIADLHVAEDALFVASYLLAAPNHRVVMAADAEYFYRKRETGDSAVDTFKDDPDFYFGRFERGYIPIMARAAAQGGVPVWLQMALLYDLRWFFPRELAVARKATDMSAADKARVLDLVAQALRFVDDESIQVFRITHLPLDYRCLFLALKGSPLPSEGIAKTVPHAGPATEIRYLYARDLPHESFTLDGVPVEPSAAKIRRLDFFDQRVLMERIVWLDNRGTVSLTLDGRPVEVEKETYRVVSLPEAVDAIEVARTQNKARRAGLPRHLAAELAKQGAAIVPGAFGFVPRVQKRGLKLREKRRARVERVWLQVRRPGREFEGAWLLMDKLRGAGDSAEYLYRHLRDHEPGVNAWFVLNEDSPDWLRLKADGFRLIGYGTHRHHVALQRAKVLASTHLDVEVTNPIPENAYPHGRPWRFVYLQHGVLQHDLSIWFNGKPIDLITTASVDEQESIVEDFSSYKLTTKQSKLTGVPRHDEVLRLRELADPAERRIILLAPTWRNKLLAPKAKTGALRKLVEPIEDTEFGINWLGLANDPRLARLAEQTGSRVVFLPHPNFRTQLDPGLVAEHVEYAASVPSVHELLTRCRAVVTDYSSIFFEGALAGADISYFQFDQEEFLNGGHTYVPGSWSYDKHGLGPVSLTIDDAVDVLERQLLAPEGHDREVYRARLARTLPCVDGRSVVRITEEIKQLLTGTSPRVVSAPRPEHATRGSR